VTALQLAADLSFSVTLPEGETHEHPKLEGTLRGNGSTLELRLSDTAAFTGGGGLRLARGFADALVPTGLTLTVVDPNGTVATLGAVRSSWTQRRLTGSRHIRVGRLRAVLPMLRSRQGTRRPALAAIPVPAPTLFPLAPTFRRPRRRPVTTTHDPEGGGRPRLVFAPGPSPWPGEQQRVFDLGPAVTTIGSAATADLRLEGLAPEHAEIHRTADDEFVFVQLSRTEVSLVNGARVRPEQLDSSRPPLLRTGTRVQVGRWTMSYSREEYADHGRPYGGRVGGEFGHQRPQPPRPRGSAPSF
jgi:hypothetical protein